MMYIVVCQTCSGKVCGCFPPLDTSDILIRKKGKYKICYIKSRLLQFPFVPDWMLFLTSAANLEETQRKERFSFLSHVNILQQG